MGNFKNNLGNNNDKGFVNVLEENEQIKHQIDKQEQHSISQAKKDKEW